MLKECVLCATLFTLTAGSEASSVDIENTQSVPENSQTLIRRSGEEFQRTVITQVSPTLPPLLQGIRIRGKVFLEVIVDQRGKVVSARPLWGSSLLQVAALEAALKWEWNAIKSNGAPARVVGVISFDFTTERFSSVDKELAFFTQARANADSARAHYNLAEVYLWRNRVKEAIEEYKQAIELDPDFSLAYYGLGESYYQLDNYSQAINSYEQALRIKPDFVEAVLRLGWSNKRLRNYDQAVEFFRRAISVAGDLESKSIAYGNIAEIYEKTQRINDAIEAYQHKMEIDKQLSTAAPELSLKSPQTTAFDVGILCEKVGRVEDAMEAYKQVLELAPKSSESFYSRLHIASIYKMQGLRKEANNIYTNMLEMMNEGLRTNRAIDASTRVIYFGLGLVHEEMDDHRKAIEAFRNAIKLDPEWIDPHMALHILYVKTGDTAAARSEEVTIKMLSETAAEQLRTMKSALDVVRRKSQ